MTAAWLAALLAGAAGVAAALTAYLARPGSWLSVLDLPNERSLHTRPTPRTGGVAILAAAAAAWGVVAAGWGLPAGFGPVALGAALVAAVSLADDHRSVPARVRLAVHLAGAALVVLAGLRLHALPLPGLAAALPAWAGVALTVGFVAWMTNLYNFMDGMDGFAGGMTASGFGVLGAALWWHGDAAGGAAALALAGGAAGFLTANFPPARIFMGDVGSAPLGMLAAALALHADRAGALPLWASVLAFSPFVVDATVTLARRLARGEKIWQAHRTHYYQRLVQLGWGHRRTVLAEYALMLGAGATALAAPALPVAAQQVVLAGWAALYVAAMWAVRRLERRRAG